jgi:hypothetical protein
MATSLIAKLQAKGAKIYTGSPLWERGDLVAEITIDDNHVVTDSSKYNGKVLACQEPDGTAYIQLKQDTAPDKASYKVYEFTAVRDWADYGISSGDTKLMAV